MVFLTLIIGLALIPTLTLFVEVLAALASGKEQACDDGAAAGTVAVVIPAHNESIGIIPTLRDIVPQLRARDRLIVVADNCSDDTAPVAAAHGAQVLVRNEPDKRGKGYAMAWAVTHLAVDPPDFVLFVDADCRLQPDFVAKVLGHSSRREKPVQALYLMTGAETAGDSQRVAEFAWRLKNWVRPLGLTFLGRPVQLMGTGMMFPWKVIKSAPLASGSIVEDLKLGLDLAIAGSPASFLPSGRVTSEFAATERGAETQRQRWVQGHLAMISGYVPRLLAAAIVNGNVDLLALALDLLVPPLSLLVLIAGAVLLIAVTFALLTGNMNPTCLAFLNLVLLAVSIMLAWSRFGRDVLPGRRILSVLSHIPHRLYLFRRLARGGASEWVRTDRQKPE
ncbi:cellulose synthase/poly-beta-1,6-N-acetylglucosamine synthase-like glycosyltransferase [Bradyrhizobium sp. USDA 4463]